MKWRAAPSELVQIFDAAIGALPEAEKRKMFGYPAAFSNGYMLAGLHQESFVLRLSPADYTAFLKIEGAIPFEPMPGRSMGNFVAVPPAMLQSPEELQSWLKKAFANAKAMPPKAPKVKTLRRK